MFGRLHHFSTRTDLIFLAVFHHFGTLTDSLFLAVFTILGP